MSHKHYNAAYLADTANLLKGIKLSSYEYFSKIPSGVIIDLGCGTGIDVIQMAKMFSNQFNVVGIDHDASLIEIAKGNSSELKNASFIVSEGNSIPFEDSSVEGLRAERLVQHLQNPKGVFDEAYRILKQDAPIVIVESDWSSLNFYCGSPDISQRMTEYLTKQKINNGSASKKLNTYFEESNFANTSINVHPFVLSSLLDANTYLWIDKIIEEMYQKEIISLEERDIFKNDIEIADQEKYFACSMNIVIGSAKKP